MLPLIVVVSLAIERVAGTGAGGVPLVGLTPRRLRVTPFMALLTVLPGLVKLTPEMLKAASCVAATVGEGRESGAAVGLGHLNGIRRSGLRGGEEQICAARALQHRGGDPGIARGGVDRRGEPGKGVIAAVDRDTEARAAEGHLQRAGADRAAAHGVRQQLLRRGERGDRDVVGAGGCAAAGGRREDRRRAAVGGLELEGTRGVECSE